MLHGRAFDINLGLHFFRVPEALLLVVCVIFEGLHDLQLSAQLGGLQTKISREKLALLPLLTSMDSYLKIIYDLLFFPRLVLVLHLHDGEHVLDELLLEDLPLGPDLEDALHALGDLGLLPEGDEGVPQHALALGQKLGGLLALAVLREEKTTAIRE